MEGIKEYLSQVGTDVILQIILGLIILIVGLKLTKLIIKWIGKGKVFSHMDKNVRGFVISFTKIVLYALVISSAAMCWGVPATSFLTMFASAGVAIGLALQGALSNFAGGLMILFFKPFSVGDFIENGAVSGTVKSITVIYTILNTPDNKTITIPNGTLMGSNIINYATQDTRRIDITVSASYNDDVERVKALLQEIAAGNQKIMKDPAPVARLNEFGDSALKYTFKVWVKSVDYWDVYFELMETIKKAFDENGIEIPFQKVDIRMLSDKN